VRTVSRLRVGGGLALLLLGASLGAGAPDDSVGTEAARPSVRVVSPSSADIPVGDTRIVAAVEGYVAGDQLDVFVDGRKIGSVAQPPWQVGWQGLYRAGDCSVDLRIEPELKSERAAVIGQITNHVMPELEMGNLPVCLRAGKQVVAETVSNRFGEFQLEYDQQAQLKLYIHLQDSKSIQVPLKRFSSDQLARKKRPPARKRAAGKQ